MSRSSVTQGQAHILLIDDQPEYLRPLLELLSAQGFRVSLASDARQGLQRALALRPDLIVLDVHMPQLDGFTVCRLLREDPRARAIPVIFLTAAISLEERLEGLSLGGVDYVLKPFVAEEVLARIRIHLQLGWRHERPETVVPQAVADPDQVILQAAMRLIARDLEKLPSLQDIARKVGTHDKKLSAIFRRHLGLTVFAFAREERLRKGQELLADSNLSIQDIAELVGFSSACNFSTAFREKLGVTPSDFRDQTRGGERQTCISPFGSEV